MWLSFALHSLTIVVMVPGKNKVAREKDFVITKPLFVASLPQSFLDKSIDGV